MKIKPGTKVKCLLQNGYLAEGKVINWGEDYIELECYDNTITIIHDPKQICITKIQIEDVPENKKYSSLTLEKEFDDTYNKPSVPQTPEGNLRHKKMAELKIMMQEQERKIISEKLRDHTPSGVLKVNYGEPGFLSNKNIK